jgi:hypothetical protein
MAIVLPIFALPEAPKSQCVAETERGIPKLIA